MAIRVKEIGEKKETFFFTIGLTRRKRLWFHAQDRRRKQREKSDMRCKRLNFF